MKATTNVSGWKSCAIRSISCSTTPVGLRAAYLSTLLAAIALGRTWVALTLIGGGAFGNPMPLIWTAIEWALDEAEPYLVRDLEVVVNGRNLPLSMRWAVLAAVKRRDGAYVTFTSRWLDTVQR
ncbi:MAG: hypothetical protein U0768_15885 [Anaerolineae bacterium]